MTTREKCKRAVIEAIHGLPYDEAIKKELGLPITLGRVLKAVKNYILNRKTETINEAKMYSELWEEMFIKIIRGWKLTKADGSECTDDDQTNETIEKLYKLLNS